MLVITVRTLVR